MSDPIAVRSARPDCGHAASFEFGLRNSGESGITELPTISLWQQITIRSVSTANAESSTFFVIAPAQMQLHLVDVFCSRVGWSGTGFSVGASLHAEQPPDSPGVPT